MGCAFCPGDFDPFDRPCRIDEAVCCVRGVGATKAGLRWNMHNAVRFVFCEGSLVCKRCRCNFLSRGTDNVKRERICARNSTCCCAEMGDVVTAIQVNCEWKIARGSYAFRLIEMGRDCDCGGSARDEFVRCFVVFMPCVAHARAFKL